MDDGGRELENAVVTISIDEDGLIMDTGKAAKQCEEDPRHLGWKRTKVKKMEITEWPGGDHGNKGEI